MPTIELLGSRFKNPKRRAKRKPRGRSAGGVNRPSQATGKKPTKRLVKRRRKTLRAPAGVFANPVKHGYTVSAKGAEIATFKTRAHAAQYGQAFADTYQISVKVSKR